MIDAIKFWVAKALVDLVVGLIVAGLSLLFIGLMIWLDARARRK